VHIAADEGGGGGGGGGESCRLYSRGGRRRVAVAVADPQRTRPRA